MIKNIHYKYISFFLIILSISSYFIGFIYGENSAGGGPADFIHVWSNLQTFLNNSIVDGVHLTASNDPETYMSARTPLVYIFHKIFNPFVGNEIIFKRSVFFISFLVPILFYISLKEKFKKEENLLLLLISSIIFLSPYFRTSSFWALEENLGLISLLISFLFLNKFLNNDNNLWKNYYQLFLTVFFSSACVYFDQKFVIIPIICFIKIIFSDKYLKLKFYSFIMYFILSLPFIYLMVLWGGIIPTRDAAARGVGYQIFIHHLGYVFTIFAFYFFPLLFFKREDLSKIIKNFFSEKKNYYFIYAFFIYLIYLLFFHNYSEEHTMGKGFIHKTALLFFKDIFLQKLFIYSSFFFSWIVILIYLNDSKKNKLILSYFFLLAILVFPLMQEYFDPLIILMAFTFFDSNFLLNYKKSIFLYLYLSFLLISSNIYYYNLII